MKKSKYWDDVLIVKALISSVVLLIVLAVVILEIIAYSNTSTHTITVADKYVKARNESEDIYIVVDSNGDAYEISDLLLLGKFNSTDIYNQMKIGEEYDVETTGYRIRIFSMYPNINKVSPIK